MVAAMRTSNRRRRRPAQPLGRRTADPAGYLAPPLYEGANMPAQPRACEGARPPLRDTAASAVKGPLTCTPAARGSSTAPSVRRQAPVTTTHAWNLPPGSLPRERKRIRERRDKEDSREIESRVVLLLLGRREHRCWNQERMRFFRAVVLWLGRFDGWIKVNNDWMVR
jgi:hypothetical protein